MFISQDRNPGYLVTLPTSVVDWTLAASSTSSWARRTHHEGLACVYALLQSKQSNFFSRFEPKQTETQSVSVVFQFVSRNQNTLFSVCLGVSDRYRNNRNKQNFVETNWKNLQKTFSIRESSKLLIFFLSSNRNSIFVGCFSVFFSRNQKGLFQFVSVFRIGIETTETNRTYGMGN